MSKRARPRDDRKIVDAFVAHLRENRHPGLRVDRRPDEENHASPDIDAVAGPLAIEHTSVDVLPNQRGDAASFKRAMGRIEKDPDIKLPCRLNITVEYTAIEKGQDWAAILQALRDWLVKEAWALPNGRHALAAIPGVPFSLKVIKTADRPPGVFFARSRPHDATLPQRLRDQFQPKAAKLAKYVGPESTTVLLVDSGDKALINPWEMREAIRQAFPEGLPHGVQELWHADTSLPGLIEFSQFNIG